MSIVSLIIILPIAFKMLLDYEPDSVKFKRIKSGKQRTDNKYMLYAVGVVMIIYYVVELIHK